jgi:hypothetical protein
MLSFQCFGSAIDRVPCNELVLEMSIPEGEAAPLFLQLGRSHLAITGCSQQNLKFSWHDFPPLSSVAESGTTDAVVHDR